MLQGLGIVVCLVVGFGMLYLIYGRTKNLSAFERYAYLSCCRGGLKGYI